MLEEPSRGSIMKIYFPGFSSGGMIYGVSFSSDVMAQIAFDLPMIVVKVISDDDDSSFVSEDDSMGEHMEEDDEDSLKVETIDEIPIEGRISSAVDDYEMEDQF